MTLKFYLFSVQIFLLLFLSTVWKKILGEMIICKMTTYSSPNRWDCDFFL